LPDASAGALVVLMAEAERVQNLIIGSGESGKWLAWDLGAQGRETVVVERRWIGGSCPNINCLPSKNEIHSAKVAHTVRHAAAFGTEVTAARVDMAQVLARKRQMVEDEIAGHLSRFRQAGTQLILGEARFVAAKTIEVALRGGGTRRLVGERVFLNLGTRPSIPPIPGLAETALTNIGLLELEHAPEHLVVLGGGYVGLELGQAYRRFGSRVTVIARGHQLLEHEDTDVAAALSQLLRDEGVELLLETETLRIAGRRGALRVLVGGNGAARAIEASDVLAALGRTPNSDGIGLELAGVDCDARGYIRVNDRLETSAPDVWALGECAGSPQFTHAAFDDFRVVRDNLAGRSRCKRGRLVPFCLFTDPPLARVGLNEREARGLDLAVRVASLPLRQVLRAHTTGEVRGFMKALIDAQHDRIVGFTMFGAEAGEVASVVQMAMLAGLPYTRLRDAILAHPTMAEGLNVLFRQELRPAQEAQPFEGRAELP
jgi:pyruvate/2-oxoglutarate dehydrogenase complex dihydrolipoamide dehydrogenase (E3) component